MAEDLARIYGTEEDKVNCPFYFKIGACRHGDRCSRTHHRPLFSQTLLVPHFYAPPPLHPVTGQPTENEKEHITEFCLEVLDELQTFGSLEEFHVVGNLGEHMLGNVYLKYSREEEAEKALKALNGRFYAGRQLTVEYSPVSDFRESRCRQYDEETCNRGPFCNFMHMRPLPSAVRKELDYIRDKNMRRAERRAASSHHGSSSRRERSRSRDKDRDAHRDRDRDRDRERDRDRGRRSSRSPPRRDERPAGAASSSSSTGGAPRSESEERRAKIAEWNKRRAEQAGGAAH